MSKKNNKKQSTYFKNKKASYKNVIYKKPQNNTQEPRTENEKIEELKKLLDKDVFTYETYNAFPDNEPAFDNGLTCDFRTIKGRLNRVAIKFYISAALIAKDMDWNNICVAFRVLRDYTRFFGEKTINELSEEEFKQYIDSIEKENYSNTTFNMILKSLEDFYYIYLIAEPELPPFRIPQYYKNESEENYAEFLYSDILRVHKK